MELEGLKARIASLAPTSVKIYMVLYLMGPQSITKLAELAGTCRLTVRRHLNRLGVYGLVKETEGRYYVRVQD